jgi:branched-chain amino acid transport system substrate-binding protein
MSEFRLSRRTMLAGSTAALVHSWSRSAWADDTIRIGMIIEGSGVFAELGRQARTAAELYQRQNGDTVAGKKVEIIYRDTGGSNADLARRHAQELVTTEHVQFLAGFGLSPIALAAAPIATAAKVPLVIMNAGAAAGLTTKSPFIVRYSFTMAQVTNPLAQWAKANGFDKIYTMVADYAPGIDAETSFQKTFEAAGGAITGKVRFPLTGFDFSAYLARARDTGPQAIFAFPGSGEGGLQLIKAYREQGMDNDGIKLMGIGDMTDDAYLEAIGPSALGIVTSHHYSVALQSPENESFVAAWREAYGKDTRPNYYAAASWDGMHAIYEVIKRLNGNIDGEAAVQAFQEISFSGPRGVVRLNGNRDIVQDVYIRKVEKVGDSLYNVPIQRFEAVAPDVQPPA